ncbi:hypothetical protein [Streptosporangium canum]|uniref:hypothetical protein n=1 Tax=Streptosporangium canum TaxID=324952 RepID=UPI00378DF0C4
MTITITHSCALLHTTGRDLKALFEAVLAHASQDDNDLPTLRQVHIEVHDGDLRLVCSDRFTMGIARQPLTSATENFACTFAVSAWQIRALVEAVDGSASVTVSIEDNRLLVTTDDKMHHLPGEESVLPWRMVLGRYLNPAPAPTGRFLMNPAFLARLAPARALQEDGVLQMQMHGEHQAVIATLGERFLALVMPMRDNGRIKALPSRPLDGWFDLIDEN